MTLRMGINGFGRTGRACSEPRLAPSSTSRWWRSTTSAAPEALARLLARDSVYGRFDRTVAIDDRAMVVGGHRILLPAEHEVKALPWGALGVDVVVEATGRFTARADAAAISTRAHPG